MGFPWMCGAHIYNNFGVADDAVLDHIDYLGAVFVDFTAEREGVLIKGVVCSPRSKMF